MYAFTRQTALLVGVVFHCPVCPASTGLQAQSRDIHRVDTIPATVLPSDRDEPFGQVTGAVRLSDGSLVVADQSYHTVRFFDSKGRQFATVGRKGSGPGEFRLLSSIQRCGVDSVYAFDAEQGRVTVLDPRGKIVREFSLLAGGNRLTYGVVCNGSRSLLVLGWPRFRKDIPLGPYRETMSLYQADMGGRNLGLVVESLADERYRASTSDGPRIFGKQLIVAGSGDRLYVGEGDRYEVAVMHPDGRVVDTLVKEMAPARVTRAEIDRFQSAHLALVRNPAYRESQRRGFIDYEFPPRFPPYSGILIDPGRNIWVRDYRPPSQSRERWTVFGYDGSLLEEVAMPANLEVLQVGDDFILGRTTDEEGGHQVRLHKMARH